MYSAPRLPNPVCHRGLPTPPRATDSSSGPSLSPWRQLLHPKSAHGLSPSVSSFSPPWSRWSPPRAQSFLPQPFWGSRQPGRASEPGDHTHGDKVTSSHCSGTENSGALPCVCMARNSPCRCGTPPAGAALGKYNLAASHCLHRGAFVLALPPSRPALRPHPTLSQGLNGLQHRKGQQETHGPQPREGSVWGEDTLLSGNRAEDPEPQRHKGCLTLP